MAKRVLARGGRLPEDFTYNTCVSASNFTDSNGTRLVMETCDRFDTSQLWNLG